VIALVSYENKVGIPAAIIIELCLPWYTTGATTTLETGACERQGEQQHSHRKAYASVCESSVPPKLNIDVNL
jgi:hypothetical protein